MTDNREAEAVAWIHRTTNGNVRLWTQDRKLAQDHCDVWSVEPECLYPASSLSSRDERIRELEGENAKLRDLSSESIRLMTQYAREAGEATGKLDASELAGIVDDWKARALKAEALLEEAVKGLVADLERRANSCCELKHATKDARDAHRLMGKEAAYLHAAELARATLSAITKDGQ